MLPASLTLSNTLLFLIIFSLAVLCICGLARMLLGKESSLKHALVSSLGIIMLYCVCVMIYTFNPAGLSSYLTPLPYVDFVGSEIQLFKFSTSDLTTISKQILSMLVLSFLVNQINSFTPGKLKMLGWLGFRVCCIFVAIFAHYLIYRILNKFTGDLHGQLLEYAPFILLVILIFMFSLGFIKLVAGLFLTVVNPVLGGIFTFFFANKIGKNISRAIGTTTALTLYIMTLHRLGYSSPPIGAGVLSQYIPFCLCITLLWVFIGHKR
jgi:hypothetical protein